MPRFVKILRMAGELFTANQNFMMNAPAFPSESKPLHQLLAIPKSNAFTRHPGVAAFMVGVSLALCACGGGDDPKPESSRTESSGQLVQDGVFDAKLKGAWRVLGEGQLFEIDDHEIRVFQEAATLCYPDLRNSMSSGDMKGFNYRHVSESNSVTADIHVKDNPPKVVLERLPKIPDSCRKEPPADPVTVFKTMWEMFDLDYGFFKERNIDWAARLSSLQQKAAAAADDDALQSVLVEALHDFNDYHVSLIRFRGDESVYAMGTAYGTGNTPTQQLLRRAFAQQSDISSLDEFDSQWRERMRTSLSRCLVPGSERHALNDAMVWGLLPGNIGYIQLSREYAFDDLNIEREVKDFSAEMDAVIAALANTKAIVFDIAVNDGGYDDVSAAVAARFADRRRLALTVQARRAQGREIQEWFVEPEGPRQYLKPVYLLTTDRTISAGDSLTLMMRELPHVIHIGQPTSGSMSDNLTKSLPGNFMISLSNESYFDSKGVLYEGRGVPPKVGLQVFHTSDPASLYAGHEAAIRKIIDMING